MYTVAVSSEKIRWVAPGSNGGNTVMSSVPDTTAPTLGRSIGLESEWFDDQRVASEPDLVIWPSLIGYPAMQDLVRDQEAALLLRFGTWSNHINWPLPGPRTEMTRWLVDQIRSLLVSSLTNGMLYWGFDSLLMFLPDGSGFVYHSDETVPHSILVRPMEPSDVFDAILETWRRGGPEGDTARKWLCDGVVTSIHAEHRSSAMAAHT